MIDLQRCLNLLDHSMIELVKVAHAELMTLLASAGTSPPRNHGGRDLLQRYLDCAVIEHVHQHHAETGVGPPFDTVRAVFVEGDPIYPGAGFHEKSHIQICVRNTLCIKGYFRVLDDGERIAGRSGA